MASGWSRCTRRCPGPAGSPAGATAPTRRCPRSTPGSAPRPSLRWPARCRRRGAGGRRGRTSTRPCMAVSIDGAAPPAAVQAEVERRHHLVFVLDARVDVDQRAQPVEPQDGQAGLGERAEVAAGALDPHQLDVGSPVTGSTLGPLGRGVAAGVVGVAGVGTEAVAPAPRSSATAAGEVGRSCMRPTRPPGHRRARRRCAPGSPTARRRPSGQGRGPVRRAPRRAAAGRRCCRRPSARALAPRTSPSAWAAASASRSTSSALAVASCTFMTERIWAGILGSMLWHWSSMNATPAAGAGRRRRRSRS